MVMKIRMLTSPLLCLAGLLLCGAAVAQGRVLYLENCAACHGQSGAGDGALAKVLIVDVPDLRHLSALSGGRFPEDWVRSVIDGREQILSHGDRTMPVWGSEFWLEEGGDDDAELETRARIRDLTDYLASIQVAD
jgi:mono/diheme cytochrome c family protein